MKTLSALKKDLEFNAGLSSLIEVLKNIAVAQFRILEQKIKSFEELLSTIDGFFEFIDIKKISHPFLSPQNKIQAVVAVTSDSGLLGGLNMQIMTCAFKELKKTPGKLIVIGDRGKIYASESGMPYTAFPGIIDEERYSQAVQIGEYISTKLLKGDFGYLKVIYPKPVSFTVQSVEMLSFLPFETKTQMFLQSSDIILESKPKDIVEYLVSLWMREKFSIIFGLSKLAEFAARYVHLEGSLQKLKEMDNKLRLQYFRARHELIDRNMRELFSARLLYAK